MRVYFIQIAKKQGPVKIGTAMDVDKRLKVLQIANPYKLQIISVLVCKSKKHAYAIEEQLHKEFKRYLIRGEWFSYEVIEKIPEVMARSLEYIDKPSRKYKKDRYTEYKNTLG